MNEVITTDEETIKNKIFTRNSEVMGAITIIFNVILLTYNTLKGK